MQGKLTGPQLELSGRQKPKRGGRRAAPSSEQELFSPRVKPRQGRRMSLADLAQLQGMTTSVHRQIQVPDSEERHQWDVLLMMLTMYSCAVVPFTSTFMDTIHAPLLLIDYLVDLVFVADVVLGFNTAFYTSSGDLVVEQRPICENYLRGWFPCELFATGLPLLGEWTMLALGLNVSESGLFRSVRLLRFLRIARVIKYEKAHYKYGPLYRVSQLLFGFVYLVHFVASILYLSFANAGDARHELNWQDGGYDMRNSTPPARYANSLYISLLMIIGEDTDPMYTAEKYFTTVVMLAGALFYATIFGSAAVLLKGLDSQKVEYYETMDSINNRMRIMGLDDALGSRVKAFYMYIWKRLKSFSYDDTFLDDLPFALRADIAMQLHKETVEKVPFFQGCDRRFIASIVVRISPQINMPGDTIIVEGEIGSSMYFISSGKVEIVNAQDQVIRVLGKGDYFGEFALLISEKRTASVVAKTFCELQVLLKEDFDTIMADWPQYVKNLQRIAEARVQSVSKSDNGLGNAKFKVFRKGGAMATAVTVNRAVNKFKKLGTSATFAGTGSAPRTGSGGTPRAGLGGGMNSGSFKDLTALRQKTAADAEAEGAPAGAGKPGGAALDDLTAQLEAVERNVALSVVQMEMRLNTKVGKLEDALNSIAQTLGGLAAAKSGP